MTRLNKPGGEPGERPQVLLADPDELVCQGLAERLRFAGHAVDAVADAEAALQQLRRKIYDLAILDVALAHSGTALRDLQRDGDADCPVLVLVPSLRPVEALADELNMPVADLVVKPVLGNALVAAASRALEAARQARRLRHAVRRPLGFDDLLGESPRWLETLHLAERMARCDETVCLQGETGTGKSHLAEAIHGSSPRGGNPLVTAVVPPGQPERQLDDLFGHRAGAFTGAAQARNGFFRAAHRSTLFLDEVADLSPEAQFFLLRALQNRVIRPLGSDTEIAVDVRVLTATNKDLAAEVGAGRFREDLFHRLNLLPLVLPPLRERREDILPLARHFVQQQAEKVGYPTPHLAPATEQALLGHSWPGNVRELHNRVARGVILGSNDRLIRPGDCGLADGVSVPRRGGGDVLPGESLEAYVERCKRRYFTHLVEVYGDDRKRMAEAAQIHPSTLREKLKEYLGDRL
jgi:DNA-binding NtrC family response regulator